MIGKWPEWRMLPAISRAKLKIEKKTDNPGLNGVAALLKMRAPGKPPSVATWRSPAIVLGAPSRPMKLFWRGWPIFRSSISMSLSPVTGKCSGNPVDDSGWFPTMAMLGRGNRRDAPLYFVLGQLPSRRSRQQPTGCQFSYRKLIAAAGS